MDARDAIRTAKMYTADVFSDESPMNIGLEEIRFNDDRMVWEVTIGFSRPWDQVSEKNWILPGERVRYDRTYKVVEIADTDGRVLGISNRALSEAA